MAERSNFILQPRSFLYWHKRQEAVADKAFVQQSKKAMASVIGKGDGSVGQKPADKFGLVSTMAR
jgi:hypothetical protein